MTKLRENKVERLDDTLVVGIRMLSAYGSSGLAFAFDHESHGLSALSGGQAAPDPFPSAIFIQVAGNESPLWHIATTGFHHQIGICFGDRPELDSVSLNEF